MAADVIAPSPCVAMTSAAIVLTMLDKEVLVFHEGGFQLPVSLLWDDRNMYLHTRIKVK